MTEIHQSVLGHCKREMTRSVHVVKCNFKPYNYRKNLNIIRMFL